MPAQKEHSEQKDLLQWIWAFPVLVPLLLVLFSYIFLSWSWGLMDDLQLLGVPGGVFERTKGIFLMYFHFGECKWTHALHCALFYKIFAHAPRLFHIFKWAEISAMLLVWGAAARRLTGRPVLVLLVPAIALSFHYLYDQFFFLSTHETTGLLFLGLALWCVVKILFGKANEKKSTYLWVAAGICLLLSLGAKETFVSGGIALGLAVAALFWLSRPFQIRYLYSGLLLAALYLAYGVVLKKVVCSVYTSGYSLFDLKVILGNFKTWVFKDLLNHTPWIAAALALWFGTRKKSALYTVAEKWGIVLGVLLYACFLAVLLPWNPTTYYAGPFGVFFAFTAAIFMAPLLETASPRRNFVIVAGALVFNLFVAQYALTRESTYHQNTQDLWQWIKGNKDFQEADRLKQVDCNAPEAAMAIPGHADRRWGLGLELFKYQGDVKQALEEGARYFVYSPRFGTHAFDASRWGTVFYSQYWQVYQRQDR